MYGHPRTPHGASKTRNRQSRAPSLRALYIRCVSRIAAAILLIALLARCASEIAAVFQ